MRKYNLIPVMLALFVWSAQGAFASDIMISNAVARATLSAAVKTSAIYLSIMNHGSVDDRLLTAKTPAASTAQIHETQMDGDVMKMREVEGGLLLPAGETIVLAPGGVHIMVMGLVAPLKKGDTVSLELTFEKAGLQKIDVPVGDIVKPHEHGG